MNRREVTKSGSRNTPDRNGRIIESVSSSSIPAARNASSAVQSFCPMTSLADMRSRANAYQAKRSFADTDPIGDRIACHIARGSFRGSATSQFREGRLTIAPRVNGRRSRPA